MTKVKPVPVPTPSKIQCEYNYETREFIFKFDYLELTPSGHVVPQ